MKLKLQHGGALSLPYAVYQPFILPTESNQSTKQSTKSSSDDSGIKMDDIYSMLKDLPGLIGDRRAVSGAISSLLSNIEYKLNNPNQFGGVSSIANEYLKLLNYVSDLESFENDYIKARDTAISKGSLDEVAINSTGQIMVNDVEDQNEYYWITPEEYVKNQNAYRPITNSELLQLRAYGIGGLTFDQSSINTVARGVSMNEITETLQSIIKSLGSNTNSNDTYVTTQSNKILKGINDYQNALKNSNMYNASVQDLYKAKLLTQDQAQQANSAIIYLYQSLSEPAKTLLKMKSDGTSEGVLSLIGSLINSSMNNKIEFEPELIESSTIKSKNTAKDESKINPAIAFQLDMGVETTLPLIAGSTDALKLQAYLMPVTTKEGNPLGITTLDKVSDTSALGGLFDFSHVTMGDQVLDMASARNIVIDGSSIYKVYLPFDQTKAAQNIITPNLNYLYLLEKVRRKVKESGAKTPEEINAIYQANNLPPFLTLDGKVNEEFYKPFGVLNATALSDAFPTTVDLNNNRNFEEVDDDNEINNYWSIIKGEDTKEKFDKKTWYNGDFGVFGKFGDYQQMFKGLIYLPVKSTDSTLGAYSGGDTPSVSTLHDYRARWQADQRQNNYTNPGQLQL